MPGRQVLRSAFIDCPNTLNASANFSMLKRHTALLVSAATLSRLDFPVLNREQVKAFAFSSMLYMAEPLLEENHRSSLRWRTHSSNNMHFSQGFCIIVLIKIGVS